MKKRVYKQQDMTAKPEKYPNGQFKIKNCRWCSEKFQPLAPSHLFCSDECKDSSFTNSYFYKKYGITYSEFSFLLEKQNHQCAICKSKGFKMHPNQAFNLVIDHDHSTGKVRGLLCHNCNRALGLFKDDIKALENSISYLKGATTIL